ncbi:hypothetical protein GGX14DRAFT_607063 [Mycena pura]|uniref:Uncharacterized protein n=1 Tax=Mycena pura TaxID=153505 RepID=A0AAD6YJM7_9AGAR|nr:hypothetical protein GGX14DRAFT_607063 [Mycena pura]
MFSAATILFACVLQSVMGLTLQTPKDTAADGTLVVSWTAGKNDPVFALLAVGKFETVDIATGLSSTSATSANVGLGFLTPGSYTLEAVVGDNIDQKIATSGTFNILPAAGAAPPPDNGAAAASGADGAAGAAAASGTPGAAANGKSGEGVTGAATTSEAATTAAAAKPSAATPAAAKPAAAKPSAAKPAAATPSAAKPAAATPAAAKPAAAKPAAAKGKGGEGRTRNRGRMVSRMEFYRD